MGSGKTVIAGNLAYSMRGNGHEILIFVHRREWVKPFYRTLEKAGLHWAPSRSGWFFSGTGASRE